MEILQTVQKNYAILGISPPHHSNQRLSFNKKVLFGFLSIGSLIFSQAMFIFYVASGFMEYMDSICAISATIVVFICFATIVLRKTKLFEMIENIKKQIGASKATNLRFSNYTIETMKMLSRKSETKKIEK